MKAKSMKYIVHVTPAAHPGEHPFATMVSDGTQVIAEVYGNTASAAVNKAAKSIISHIAQRESRMHPANQTE